MRWFCARIALSVEMFIGCSSLWILNKNQRQMFLGRDKIKLIIRFTEQKYIIFDFLGYAEKCLHYQSLVIFELLCSWWDTLFQKLKNKDSKLNYQSFIQEYPTIYSVNSYSFQISILLAFWQNRIDKKCISHYLYFLL